MPIIGAKGSPSSGGFGQFAQSSAGPVYIEDVFSTYLYTGTGTGVTQRIAPGLDLSTKGGMVWTKNRTEVTDHQIYDTARGERKYIRSNTTDAQFDSGANSVQYKTSGWDAFAYVNELNKVLTSWTFREQPKFFDIVTWSGTSNQTILHNLGSVPGCIMIKRLGSAEEWFVYHRGLPNTDPVNLDNITLNSAAAYGANVGCVGNVTSTQFFVRLNSTTAPDGYVAYVFAHNAGGFGLLGTDNVITCGSFTTDGSGNATVSLGYEPQWLLVKRTDFGGWWLVDTMRGMTVATSNNLKALFASSSAAESNGYLTKPNATGFTVGPASDIGNSVTCIYIAIRRGPMKVPTDGTTVFSPNTSAGATGTVITTGFPVDLSISQFRSGDPALWSDRLRGINSTTASVSTPRLKSEDSSAESSASITRNWGNTGIEVSTTYSGLSTIYWNIRRAPSFFDEVCFTGTGSQQNITHNLGAAPELIFVKSRSAANGGLVYNKTITASKYLKLFFGGEGDRAAVNDTGGFAGVEPTSSVFTVGTYTNVNGSGLTYVAWLFATCAGVSKVGSYTGNGSTQTIDCGFTGGARFVLIKRTDAVGNWYTYDTARGMTALTDPYLWWNDSAAEVATLGSVTTVSTGFALNAAIVAAINTSSASYIFLAIA